MAFEVLVSEAAEQDIENALTWFQNQRVGLELEFRSELAAAVNRLRVRPGMYQVKYKDMRVCFLKRFPYGIHFKLNKDKAQIVLVAVFHLAENPKKWIRR